MRGAAVGGSGCGSLTILKRGVGGEVAAQSGSSSDGERAADRLRGGGAQHSSWGATPAVCLLHSSSELCLMGPGCRPMSWLCRWVQEGG